MKETVHAFVTKRRERWRAYALLMLLAAAGGMLMSGGAPGRETAAYTGGQAEKILAGMTVALDPGHGGYDGGARAHDSGLWR